MDDLAKIVKKIKKNYGSARIVGEEEEIFEYISTGNKALDLALEGGIAWGYASEMAGLSQSGKTTMLELMLADAQKKYDAIGIWVDREKALTKSRLQGLGVNTDNLIVVDPIDVPTVPDMESFFREVLPSISPDTYKFIAIDSISSFAKEGEKADMGKKAKSLHEFFRYILPLVDNKTSLNFSNQITYKIGVMFGNPETTTGGEGPKYYCTYRLKLDNKKQISDPDRNNEIIGNWIEATVMKTRFGPGYRKIQFPFLYKTGIPYYGGYARLLVDRNYLTPKNKSEFKSFKQVMVGDGELTFSEHNIENYLKDHPELDFNIYPEFNIEDKEEEVE